MPLVHAPAYPVCTLALKHGKEKNSPVNPGGFLEFSACTEFAVSCCVLGGNISGDILPGTFIFLICDNFPTLKEKHELENEVSLAHEGTSRTLFCSTRCTGDRSSFPFTAQNHKKAGKTTACWQQFWCFQLSYCRRAAGSHRLTMLLVNGCGRRWSAKSCLLISSVLKLSV